MAVESVAESPWNGWPNAHGIGGRMGPEFALYAFDNLKVPVMLPPISPPRSPPVANLFECGETYANDLDRANQRRSLSTFRP
jgi:hypothetical protein